MKKISLLLALGLGLGVVACGGDDGGDSTAETDTSTSTDTGGSGDSDTGGTDEDTGTTPDDTGGTVEDTGGITEDTTVVDTSVPLDITPLSGPFSFVWRIQIPAAGAAECCEDLNGDGVIDNGLSTLVGLAGNFAADLDIQQTLDDSIADGSVSLLVEYAGLDKTALTGATGLWFYLASNDLDGDGSGDQDWGTDLKGGNGVFQVKPDSLNADGEAAIQFAGASIDGDHLQAGPGDFPLQVPIPGLFTLNLTIKQAQLSATVRSETTGFFTTDEEIDSDGDGAPETWGAGRLSGGAPVDQIIGVINDLANDCACAGIAADAQLVIAGEDETNGVYAMSCDPAVAYDASGCGDGDGLICAQLSLVCGTVLPILPNAGVIDFDTNGNGIFDAISVGLRLSMSGAALGDPAVQP